MGNKIIVKISNLVKKWGFSVIAIILGGITIFVLLASFNINTEKTIEKFIHENMEEMNQTAIMSLNSNLENFIDLLEKQAEIFSMSENPSDENIMSALTTFAKHENFKNTAIITFDGKVYSSFRGMAVVNKEDELPNLLNGETTVSQPRIFHDGSLVIDISTPVFINNHEIGKLVVSIDSDYIASMFFDNILHGDAALNLITQDGLVIARISKRTSPLLPKANIFDFYDKEDIEFVNGSPSELNFHMENNESTWVKYNYMDMSTCVLYEPFDRNNWYMAIAATDSTLHIQSGVIKENVLILTLSIMIILVMVAIAIVIQRVKEQKKIDNLKNTYSIAIRKTNDLFYEADIDNDNFTDYSEQKDKAIWKEPPKNYSNALTQVADICAPECKQQFLDTLLPQNIKIKMKEGISSINLEYKITPDENTVRWLSATFVPVDDGFGGTKLICMENDITEHMLRQENLKRSATIDDLTGLYNRATTKNYINWFLENEGIDGEHAFAIIDIDRFKLINDTFGHAKGDEVLAEFGHFLKKIFRKSDIVGRLGGDEFIILLKDYSIIELIIAKMEEVKKAFEKEHFLEDCKSKIVKTSASIGISIFSKDGKTFDELYKAADSALYVTKETAKGGYTFFSPNLKSKNADDI